MKIDRVILSSNDNINYYPFWNPISKVYKENFNITPTLIWIGEESDIERLGLSREYGEIIVQKEHPSYRVGWQTTWALFYFTKFFPEETLVIMGIDQLPLSDMFLRKMIEDCDGDDYVMLIDDAYRPIYWEDANGTSPSAYHIAKGKTFEKVYGFEDDFFKEAEKIYHTPVERDYNPSDAYWASGEDKWGIDESYASKMLRSYRKSGGSISALGQFQLLQKRRIECYRVVETPYDDYMLSSGQYSESHLCRPYTNHVEYINRMASLIPKYN